MPLYKTCFLFILIFCFFIHEEARSHEKRVRPYFVRSRTQLEQLSNKAETIMIASSGHSGSTLLFNTLMNFLDMKQILAKTHCLPPKSQFQGKILYIYSNPDMAAESFLNRSIKDPGFACAHFANMETSDLSWLKNIQTTANQNLSDNLLTYDALGYGKHLASWLHERTIPCHIHDAQILAIKYENLWDQETIQAIKNFLHLEELKFPQRRPRGYHGKELTELEISIREMYNLGTSEVPKYAVYDYARAIWEAAPPFQFLRILD